MTELRLSGLALVVILGSLGLPWARSHGQDGSPREAANDEELKEQIDDAVKALREGRHDDAASRFKLIRLASRSLESRAAGRSIERTCTYNLACAYSLARKTKEALDAFEEALGLGFDDWALIATDEDLDHIRGEARFKEAIAGARKRPAPVGGGEHPKSEPGADKSDRSRRKLGKPTFACTFVDGKAEEEIYSFSPDASAEKAVKEIVDRSGLAQNFVVQAASVDNAQAVIYGDQRYILYSQEFMLRLKGATGTNWSVYSVLAHEVGHHLQGHTIKAGGSRPDIELQADQFSGFILRMMGASREEAKKAMETLSPEQGSATHPGRSARIAAIINGWLKADAQLQGTSGQTQVPDSQAPGRGETTATPVPQSCPHQVQCAHVTPCVHRTNCTHAIPCQHWAMTPVGPQPAHQYDTIHPFDVMHPGDAQHQFDLAHPQGCPR